MKKVLLTLEHLKTMSPKTIIAQGVIKNNPEGFFVTRENLDRDIRWIAQRGNFHDWTIYYGWDKSIENDPEGVPIGFDMILSNGDKMYNKDIIRRCVPCTDEVFQMYRF